MFRKVSKLSFTFMFVTLLLFASTTVFAAQSNINTKRLSGINRYATSSAVALSKWTQSDYAILAFGEDFPDALSAAPLAKKYNAPILLTETNAIPEETLNTIVQLKVKNIIIIGGAGIISSAVQDKLNSMGIITSRIFGQDRYETSIKIAEQLDNVTEIAIVTGESFADALSISPVAVKENMPIILVHFNKIPDVVKNYINSHNFSKIYVITQSGVPFDNFIMNGANTDLIIGNDKYQINLNIIKKFKDDLDLSTVYLATGENFADALSGSILAGSNSNPLILVGNNLSSIKTFFVNNTGAISNIKILGGIGAVSEEVIKELTGSSANSSSTINSTVSKIEFAVNALTKTGLNTATFKYRILNQDGIDITQVIPASELNASSTIDSSISLNPTTYTGTITFKSSSDADKPIIITLIDKETGKSVTLNTKGFTSDTSVISTSIVSKIEFISTNLTKTGANVATFKYRILDENGADITKTVPVSELEVVSSLNSSISLDPSTGTGTIVIKSALPSDGFIVVTLIDKVADKVGMLNGTFLASDPISSSNQIDSNDPLLTVSKIEFISNNLTRTGTNTATFKYRILDKNGSDLTKTIPASDILADVWVDSSHASVSLNPLTGTGTITYIFSNNNSINAGLAYKNGVASTGTLILGSSETQQSKVYVIKLSTDTATKVGTNSIKFQYQILDKNNVDITKMIPASQITATITANGTISLTPSTGTGTINCASSSDIDKAIAVTLIDKVTEVKSTAQFDLRSATQKVSKIILNTTKLLLDNVGSGIASYKVLDQYGDDITFSDLARNITFSSDVGKVEIFAKGAFRVIPNPGVDLSSLTTITITGKDPNSGVLMSGTLTVSK